MSSGNENIMSNSVRRAVFVIFALLTMALVASEARSLQPAGTVNVNGSGSLLKHSLIISGANRIGARVVKIRAQH